MALSSYLSAEKVKARLTERGTVHTDSYQTLNINSEPQRKYTVIVHFIKDIVGQPEFTR